MLTSKEQDMIEHVNEEHVDELLWVVKVFTGIKTPEHAQITDVNDASISLSVIQADAEVLSVDVPFTAKGDLEEKAMLLFLEARQRLGIQPKPSKKRYFEVKRIQYASKNMLSLTLAVMGGIEDEGKLTSARFVLKKLSKLPKTPEPVTHSSGLKKASSDVFNKLALTVMKKANPTMRRKLLGAFSGGHSRTYTYSKIDSELACVQVDIFLHGDRDTPANVWALSLEEGDIIRTASENQVEVDYLQQGQALLCADETGLPAIQYLLAKQWPVPPKILIVLNNEAELDYLASLERSGAHIEYWVKTQHAQTHSADEWLVNRLAQSNCKISSAWGGMEISSAKKLKKYLKSAVGLDNSSNGIKSYWVRK